MESSLDAFDRQFDLESPAPAASAPPATPAQPATKPAEGATKPSESATQAPKSATEDESFETPQAGTLMEVRNWGKRMGAMAKSATAKVKELESQVEQLKSVSHVPPDIARLQQDYQRLQKELGTIREAQARTDWSQSPEYKKNYHEPYKQAYLRGSQAISQLAVREQDKETGQISTRQATADDWDRIYAMTDAQADVAAEEMFGPSARRVLALRDSAKERSEMAYQALQTKHAEFAEQRKASQGQEAQRNMALAGLFTKVNEDLKKKNPLWYADRSDDKQYNEDLAKGRQVASQRFSRAYTNLSPEQKVVLDAHIFNRAAATPALIGLVKRLEAKLAEANQMVSTLRGSKPGRPDVTAPGQTEASTDGGDWEKEFDEKVR